MLKYLTAFKETTTLNSKCYIYLFSKYIMLNLHWERKTLQGQQPQRLSPKYIPDYSVFDTEKKKKVVFIPSIYQALKYLGNTAAVHECNAE